MSIDLDGARFEGYQHAHQSGASFQLKGQFAAAHHLAAADLGDEDVPLAVEFCGGRPGLTVRQ